MSDFHLQRAVHHLRQGGVVLHATEGVWGLACDPFSQQAVARLLAAKQRSVSKGLLVIASQASEFAPELAGLSGTQRSAIEASWPGAHTWVVPNERFPAWITGAFSSVGIRVPGHPQARALSAAFGGPLVSTSANLAGRPSPVRQLQAVRAQRELTGGMRCYRLPGETIAPGRPSTIRAVSGGVIRA
ncbi:MAG: L-threonylcarbamoyladenylate synthase [Pseudomonadota bacterium]